MIGRWCGKRCWDDSDSSAVRFLRAPQRGVELANRPEKFSASIDCDTLLIPACRQAGHRQPERIFPAVRSRNEGLRFSRHAPARPNLFLYGASAEKIFAMFPMEC